MEYKYKAKKSLNETIEGKIEADSIEQAVEKLGREGIIPIVVEPQGSPAAAVKKEPQNLRSGKLGKWGPKRVTLFTQKLYNLVKANVELLSALKLLQQQSKDPTEKILIEEIIKNVKEGEQFSQCLSRYPQYFSSLYVNLVRAGETSGQMKDSLAQLINYLKRLGDLRMKIAQSLAYPIFMIAVGIGTVFVMLTFILPRLAGMFEDFQASLPLPTRLLLATSDIFKKYWLLMIILLVAVIAFLQSKLGKKMNLFFLLKYRLPIIKNIVYKQVVSNFSTSLSLLLKSGVNLLSALGIVIPIIENPRYIAQLEQVRQDIREGSSFSAALLKFNIFPEFFVQMIRVGEEGGRLDIVLADIADSYEQEIESDLKIISSLIEPAIILAVGLIIGSMVIAILLPIFNINALVAG